MESEPSCEFTLTQFQKFFEVDVKLTFVLSFICLDRHDDLHRTSHDRTGCLLTSSMLMLAFLCFCFAVRRWDGRQTRQGELRRVVLPSTSSANPPSLLPSQFLKRGIAVHRLGFLEPYEHWPSVTSSPSSTNPSPSSKFIALPTEVNLGRPSLDQVFSRQSILSAASSEATAVNGQDHTGPKKLFGRFFGGSKKKESGGGGSSSDFSSIFKPSGSVGGLFASKENVQPPPHSPSGASAASVTPTSSPSKSFAALGVPGSPIPSTNSVTAPSVNIAQVDSIHGPLPYLGYPTLGTQPIVRPLPPNEKSPGSRPAAYM